MYCDSKNKVGLENKTEKTFSPQGFALNEKKYRKNSIYISKEIRKAQNEHLNIVCQNLNDL